MASDIAILRSLCLCVYQLLSCTLLLLGGYTQVVDLFFFYRDMSSGSKGRAEKRRRRRTHCQWLPPGRFGYNVMKTHYRPRHRRSRFLPRHRCPTVLAKACTEGTGHRRFRLKAGTEVPFRHCLGPGYFPSRLSQVQRP